MSIFKKLKLDKEEKSWLISIVDSHLKPVQLKNQIYRTAHIKNTNRENEYINDLAYESFLLGIKYKISREV